MNIFLDADPRYGVTYKNREEEIEAMIRDEEIEKLEDEIDDLEGEIEKRRERIKELTDY